MADHPRRLVAEQPDAYLGDFAASLSNLGNRFSELDRRAEALNAAQEATEIRRQLATDQPDAYLGEGETWIKLGSDEKAIRAFEKALEVEPDHPGALCVLAFNAIASKDLPKARLWMERIRAQPRTDPAQAAALRDLFQKTFNVPAE